jgi:tetratricopeptide (TPR) repeat protein
MEPGTNFTDVFAQAAKLKSHRLKEERRSYERSPLFYRRTLFMETQLGAERALPIDELLTAAEGRKEAGNQLYEENRHEDACQAYSSALGCVRYYKSTDPDWRQNGFTDETLVEVHVESACDTPERAERLRTLMVACYLNLAQARMAVKGDNAEAIAACNEAIALDPNNAKAYFRRARARKEPASAGAVEFEAALKDLNKAALLAPKDAHVRRELERHLADTERQRAHDRSTFRGMFERGPALYDEDETLRCAARLDAEAKAMREAEGLKMMERLRELQKATERAEQQQSEPPDWANPTAKMIADAARDGIDLNDPKIRELFCEMVRCERTPPKRSAWYAAPLLAVLFSVWIVLVAVSVRSVFQGPAARRR